MKKMNGRHYYSTIHDEVGKKLTTDQLVWAMSKLRAVDERRKEEERQHVWQIVQGLYRTGKLSKDQFISDAKNMKMDNFQIVKVIREKEEKRSIKRSL